MLNQNFSFKTKISAQVYQIPLACLTSFRKEMLTRHNMYRRNHQVSALSESSSMTNLAQGYAQQMAQTGIFAHNPNAGYVGENLYTSGSSRLSTLNEATCQSKFYLKTNKLFDLNILYYKHKT
jgi:uncharacterized protein YkwD